MLRTIRRAVTVVAAAAAVTLAASSGASADVGVSGVDQMESATRVNLQDISDATFAADETGDGDGTCTNPVVAAGPVTPAANVVVGETYGLDAAEAVGHCLSYQGGSKPVTLTVSFEYQPYTGAAFVPIPGCYSASTTNYAVAGVNAITSPTTVCQYKLTNAAAGRPHRAHAVLNYSGRTYDGYSPVYLDLRLKTASIRPILDPILDPPVCACGAEEGTT